MNKKIIAITKFVLLLILLLTFKSIYVMALPGNYENFSLSQQIIAMFSADIIFLVIIIAIYFKTLKKDFKNFFKNFLTNFEIAFKYYLIGFIVMVVSNLIIVTFIKNAIAGNEEAVRSLINLAPLYMIFSVGIYAPLTEELIFRKGLRDIIDNKYIYILTSGIFFGFMHVIGSVTSPLDYLYLIPYSSLGIAFAFTYSKTNNIFSTIMMHSLHNTFAIVLYLIGSGI